MREEIEKFYNMSIEEFQERVEKQDFTETEVQLLVTEAIDCLILVGHYPSSELSRWSRDVFTVYQDEKSGQYYGISWDQGLTESQDNSFFYQPQKINRRKEEVIVDIWTPEDNKVANFIEIKREEGWI